MILIKIDNLETIKTQLPISERVLINGEKWAKGTPSMVAKIAQKIAALETAALAGKADPFLFLRLQPRAKEIWDWAVDYYGKQAMLEAYQIEKSEAA